MSRSQPYRSKMPIELIRTLDVASRITLFMVGQTGPLSFTFKDRLDNKYKTSIGPQVKCTCSPSKNDHCIHTLYVLLRIFKISTQNPILWQAAYVDSQLNDLLSGKYTVATTRRTVRPVFEQNDFSQELPSDFLSRRKMQKNITFPTTKAERMKLNEESVCPICQDEMNDEQCLSYCRVKCGNNFHSQCLKVWASHKKTTEASITCPMCRCPQGENFLLEIQQDEKSFKKEKSNKIKLKFKCSGCGVDPIPKNSHKCILCTSFELCEACYHSGKHIKHPFVRQSVENDDMWCGAEERRESQLKIKNFIDNKRKEKNVNEQLIQKLRKVQEDPNKVLDYVASSYPYVSKYISQNIDPYHKLDINPQDMKCMKCLSKKMLFLRRLPCSHFCCHECLKENTRRNKFYCDECGNKLLKGYENLIEKQKEIEEKKEQFLNVSEEFNPKNMEAGREERNERNEEEYNFVLPEEATLNDILGGGRMRESQVEQDNRRLRNRFASNIVRSTNEPTSTHYPPTSRQRTNNAQQQSSRRRQRDLPPEAPTSNNNNSIRIRNVARSTHQRSSLSRNKNQRSRQDMARMLEAMIGRKVF